MAYGTLVAWLRCAPFRTPLRRLEPAHLTELARLLPELPGVGAPVPLPEDEQRLRLFEAVRAAILAAPMPLLLIAEDLQWCDSQTLQFLHYLLRAGPEARLLVAATARPEELEERERVGGWLAAVRALGVVAEIELDRLSSDETVLLAERIAGRPLDPDKARRLSEDSEGVPLFVVESLRAEAEVTVPAGGMSDRVRAVIASRLARLSESAAELVGVAATIGREFTVPVLAEASGASQETLVRGLDELWRRAIVRARGPSSYDFSHGKIREAAYSALSPPEARDHHLRVARALLRSGSGDLDAASGEIAAHYEAAGAAEDAITWLMRAADTAQRLYASAEAGRFLERALRLVPALPATIERDALELRLLTTLPAPLLAVEGYLSGRLAEVHGRALELADALHVELEAPLIRSLALASLARGEFEAGRAFAERLRERGEREGDDVLTVEGGYVLGIAAYWQGRLAAARAHFEETIERCRPEQRSAHLVSYGQDPEVVCLSRLAHTLWLLGDKEDAERARALALEVADERGHPYSHAVAMVFAGLLALDQRDEGRLRRYADELASADRASEAPQITIVADLFAGLIEVFSGRPTTGAARVQSIVTEARRDEPATPGFHALLMRILLEAFAAAGEPGAGLAAADEALRMGGGTELWEAEIRRLRAEFIGALGAAPRDVEAELTRAIQVAGRQGARAFALRARASRERLLAGTG